MHAESPKLVEPSIRHYISKVLDGCHAKRVSIYFWILNIGVVVVISAFVAFAIYFALSKRLTPLESRQKLVHDYEAIMDQIRVYREEQMRIQTFTGLPVNA